MTSVLTNGWVATEHAVVSTQLARIWLGVGVEAGVRDAEARAPMRVVLALDRSSSMAGRRLRAAVRAARAVVEMMRDADVLGLVTFDHDVQVVAAPRPITPEVRAELHTQLEALEHGRGTALMEAALAALLDASSPERGVEGHVILLTDGYPFGRETSPSRIVAAIEEAGGSAVLSTVGIGDELDGPLLASMAEVGLGHLLRLGERDDPAGALGAELESAARTSTARIELAVRLRDARLGAHGGVAARGRDGLFVLPPLVHGEPVVVPLELVLPKPLPDGRHELGLVTLRAARRNALDAVLELPIHVEIGTSSAHPDPRVVRARSLHEVGKALRHVAEGGAEPRELVQRLFSLAGRIETCAEHAGLDADPAIREAVAVLRATARQLQEDGSTSEVELAAASLGLARQYDPDVGARNGGTLGSLRRNSQREGSQVGLAVRRSLPPSEE